MRELVILFTDGLYEVENTEHEEFGQEHLLACIRERSKVPTSQLFDKLLREIRDFSATKDFDDDVCLVGVEVKGLRPQG